MTIDEIFNDIKNQGGVMDFDNFYQVEFVSDVDDIKTTDEMMDVTVCVHNIYDEEPSEFKTLHEFCEEYGWYDED